MEPPGVETEILFRSSKTLRVHPAAKTLETGYKRKWGARLSISQTVSAKFEMDGKGDGNSVFCKRIKHTKFFQNSFPTFKQSVV